MSVSPKHTLGRAEKLKSRKQIDALFKARRFYTQQPLRVFYLIEKSGSVESSLADNALLPEIGIKAGFGSSKKFLRHASKRNRVKRLMREAYRKYKSELVEIVTAKQYSLCLFFLYGSKELVSYADIEVKLLALLNQLHKTIQEH